MKKIYSFGAALFVAGMLGAQDMRMDTYCNPLNVDYTYMIYNSSKSYFENKLKNNAPPPTIGSAYFVMSSGYMFSKLGVTYSVITRNCIDSSKGSEILFRL